MKQTFHSRRRSVALTFAGLALTGLILGASASAAEAETDPNSGPAQTLPFDEPGTGVGGNWTTSSWVADRFSYEATDGHGADLWHTVDGIPPTPELNAAFARNLNYYGGCYGTWDSTQIVCFE